MSLFRSGSEEAFRAIHDRYRQRMIAYTRQMLSGSSADAEDAVQEIFVRAYSGLRASDRHLALRAWLYRIAHNRCIDELRRPQTVPSEEISATIPNSGTSDPVTQLEQRDALRRLIADVQRLPEQQRSALLMRELAGMSYADVSGALSVSVPAVKSLLVRARIGLAQASEARDTACARIREDLIVAHDRGVRSSGLARRHMRDCPGCREFRSEIRGMSRQLAAFVPALGPIGVIAKLLGLGGAGGGGAAAGSGAVAGGGAGAATGITGTGAAVSAGAVAGAGHVATIVAAAVVTAGGAIELQHIAPPPAPHAHHHRIVTHASPARVAQTASRAPAAIGGAAITPATSSAGTGTPTSSSSTGASATSQTTAAAVTRRRAEKAAASSTTLPISQLVNPDNMSYVNGPPGTATTPSGTVPGAPGTPGTASSTASTGSTASSPGSAAGTTGSPGTTGSAGTSSAAAPPPAGTAGSGTPASGAPGSSTPAAAGSGGSTTGTVTPATSSGGAASSPTKPGPASRHAGAVAVFTVTGN